MGDLPWWYWSLFGGLLGGVFASFGGVLIDRIPRRESISGRSRCSCGAPVKPWWNTPIVGWLMLRGRAACCGQPIPARYLLGELSCSLMVAACGGAWGFAGVAAGVAAIVAASMLVALVKSWNRRT